MVSRESARCRTLFNWLRKSAAGGARLLHICCLAGAPYGSDAELAGALLVNFPAWGANCGRMRAALREKYGLATSALVFFNLFADMPSFEQEAVAIMQNALDRGLPAQLIHRAARMLQGYELMFWDAMAGVAGVGLDRGE